MEGAEQQQQQQLQPPTSTPTPTLPHVDQLTTATEQIVDYDVSLAQALEDELFHPGPRLVSHLDERARETAELADLRAKCARQDILLIQAQKQALDSENAAEISKKKEKLKCGRAHSQSSFRRATFCTLYTATYE